MTACRRSFVKFGISLRFDQHWAWRIAQARRQPFHMPLPGTRECFAGAVPFVLVNHEVVGIGFLDLRGIELAKMGADWLRNRAFGNSAAAIEPPRPVAAQRDEQQPAGRRERRLNTPGFSKLVHAFRSYCLLPTAGCLTCPCGPRM